MHARTLRAGLTGAFLFSTLLSLSVAQAVGTRRFELNRGKDFEGGDLKGVAIDSSGQVRAGFNLAALPLSEAQTVWASLTRKDGSFLLATGNEGKLLEVRGTQVRTVAESKALALTSLTEGFGGAVFVGSLPDGEILRLSSGKLEVFAKLPGAKHVWELAYDAKGSALYAATGPEGKLFRVDAKGNVQVYFDADEEHLVSLALAAQGGKAPTLYAGSSDRAKLYKINGPGRASVLYDFDRTEVRAITVNEDGSLYAIANDIKSGSTVPRRGSGNAGRNNKTTGKGVLYYFDSSGTPEKLLENQKEHFVSVSVGKDGKPHVGTGVNGRVYTIDSTHNEILVADTEERMVSVLSLDGPEHYLISSDPATLHRVEGVGGKDAVWTSKPLDAGLRAHFGRLQWNASGALELSTRSGNTKEPDDTWSQWSSPMTQPGKVQSPAGRFVQVRARWAKDPQATLNEVQLPFVTDNLRAILTEVVAETPEDGTVTRGDDGIGASGGPVTEDANPVIKLKWKVDNPDEDELRYRLQYRMLGTSRWLDILPARYSLTKKQYEWDTADMPEGRYRVRVQASDELSNPPDRSKRHELVSTVVTVDNTPPAVVELAIRGRHITGSAVDGVGPIARIEVGLAGSGDWYPFFPSDGIYDEQREDFDLNVASLPATSGEILSVRIYDASNNFVVRHVAVP